MHYLFELSTRDQLRLWGQGWDPEGPLLAVVCLLHGLGEHSERYHWLAEHLNRAGCAVITFDLRGHGRSEGRRGHAANYDVLMDDIALLLQEAAARYPAIPHFLYGHSLGGNLVVYYALKHNPALAGVIASAPLFRLSFKPPAWKTALLDVLNALHAPVPIPNGLDAAELTRDQDVQDRYREDPLTHESITPPLALNMLRNGEWILEHAAAFPLPILVMHGSADRVTSCAASEEFAGRAGPRCTLKIWDGLYHELHSEPEKQQVFDYVMDWMDERMQ